MVPPITFLCLVVGCTSESSYRANGPGANLHQQDLPSVVELPSTSLGYVGPKPIEMVNPSYPFELRRQGVEGTVVLEFTVNLQGNVQEVMVVSSPDPRFDSAAVAAISKAKFVPATHNGHTVYTRLRVPITFSIPKENHLE